MFRFLLILLLIILVFRFIGRLVLSSFIKKHAHWNNMQNQASKREEGDVIVQVNNKSNKRSDKKIGEYVQYEEVKNEKN